MNKAVQRYVEAASGLTDLTKKRAEKIVKQLVKQGEAAADQAGDLVEELLDRQRGNREAMTELIKNETQRAVRAMGLATTSEVERLQKQVAELKRELASSTGGGASAGPAEKTAKKAAGTSPAKKAATKTAAKRTAKKTAATKASKKAASTSPAARAAKKTAAKKTAQRGGSNA